MINTHSICPLRSLLVLTAALLFCTPALAQEGTVVYEERIRIEIELPPELHHMRNQIPSERTTRRELLFSGERSLWRTVAQEAEQLEMETGRRMMMRFGGSGRDVSETFTDRESNVQLEHREFLGRTFLIADTVQVLPWRLTGERAEFRGYMTMQATAATSDTTSVEAWFTPEIPASSRTGAIWRSSGPDPDADGRWREAQLCRSGNFLRRARPIRTARSNTGAPCHPAGVRRPY